MAKRTTLTTIAQAAGVSIATVDRVVNRRGGVSAAAEARVLEWANRLDLDRRLFRGHVRMLRVAVMMQSPANPFYRSMGKAFADNASFAADLRIACFIHHIDVTDIATTASRIARVSQTHDALIVVCPNEPILSEALRSASRRIPVVTMVTDLADSGRIAYVGPDNHRLGRVAGELMGRFLGPLGGEVLILLGMHRMAGHREREIGFRSVLRERFPTCVIAAALESAEDRRRAGDVVHAAFRSNPRINGVYNVSAGNLAIATAIRSLGLAHRAVIITHEITPERRRLLRDGVLDAVIDQNPTLEAMRAIEVLGRHFKRIAGDVKLGEHTPFSIFVRENCPSPDAAVA
jgi:LacI family transcriptional regulator